jgi:hypothetical protein
MHAYLYDENTHASQDRYCALYLHNACDFSEMIFNCDIIRAFTLLIDTV